MKRTFLDECFKAWMDYPRDRFPLEDFRRCFKEQYRRNGIVMIQPITNKHMDGVMIADVQHGFMFNNEHNLEIAMRLIRLWGFNITTRLEHDDIRSYTAYIVHLPEEYLLHHLGRNKSGIIRTYLRRIANVDRTKIKKPND